MKAFELHFEREREIQPLLLVGGAEHARDINGIVVYAEALFWNWPDAPERIRLGWTLLRFRGDAAEQERDFIATEGAKIWAEEHFPGDGSAAVALKARWHDIEEAEIAIKKRVLRSSLLNDFGNDARFAVSEFLERATFSDSNVSLWDSIAPFCRATRNPQ